MRQNHSDPTLKAAIGSERKIVNTTTFPSGALCKPSSHLQIVSSITTHVHVAPNSTRSPYVPSICVKLCFLTLSIKRMIHILTTHNELASAHKPLAEMHDLRKAARA